MASWASVKFGSLAAPDRASFSMGPFGSKIVKENYVKTGVPVVRGVNLASGRFVDSDFVYITPEKADELQSANVAPGDLIFTHRGTIGQVSMIPRLPKHGRYIIGSSQVKARLDETRAHPEFFYYWFKSPQGQHSILANTSTVGVPGIATPLTTIRNLIVPNPPLSVQCWVAAILGALDDKIAVNGRMAGTARALGMALFEESLQDDGQTVAISSISSTVARGGAPGYTEDATEPVVVNQKCIRAGRVDLGPARRTLSSRVRADRILRIGDVLVNSTGVGTLGRVAIWTHDVTATCDSHVTIVRPDSMAMPPVIAGYAILAAEPEIEMLGEGSTGQTELSRHKLSDFKVRVPPAVRRDALAEPLMKLEWRAGAALSENAALSQLRDTLLPKLVSGELRIRDAEREVSAAV